jgi:hypothetical protein
MSSARSKSFDIIAVRKLDRYFRNLRLLLNYLYELEQLEIKFVSTQEGPDTSTPYGKFDVQIMVFGGENPVYMWGVIGAIPPQLLGMNNVRESLPAPAISSGRGGHRG